ncbi:MAG: helix-turn-helix domain-containing protein [Janthinobacterium lividum]
MRVSVNGGFSAIIPAQVRAARALLGWSRDRLSETCGVPVRTLDRLEKGQGSPQLRTVEAIRTALEMAGVEFTNDDAPGVKLRSAVNG